MSDLDAFLAGIVADPHNALRWLVMADWLEDHGFPERAELVRVHRELLRTCADPDAHPDRPQLHARMMELMRAGVKPCLPQKTITLPRGVELRMSFIPPGSFRMGSPKSEKGRTNAEQPHRVTLTKGYWLAVTLLTQEQWWAVMGNNPSRVKSFRGDNLPVETVSWNDARIYCKAVLARAGANVRLPTEAEWEYAARAGTTTPFYWGTELNGTQANCNGNLPYGTSKLGPNLNSTTSGERYTTVSPHPWGLTDVIGNVSEWCEDSYGAFPKVEVVDPCSLESSTRRIRRGGSFGSAAMHCRAARRDNSSPEFRFDWLGFRIAADAAGP